MMKIIFFVMLGVWSYGEAYSNGGGVYTYADSTGNRYGGTYGLKDGKVVSSSGDPFNYNYITGPVAFSDNVYDGGDFGANYFPNFENFLHEFPGYNNIPPYGFPFSNFGMPHNFPNSAFASAAAGPGYNRHFAAINPANPAIPNVNRVSHFADTSSPGHGGYYAVSSQSFSSSANNNGQAVNHRGAETMVNDNGKITHYKVHN